VNAPEQPVPLQSDTITPQPGGGVRAVTAYVLINGVPTPVQMQVIAVADAQGRVLNNLPDMYDPFEAVVSELRAIKQLLGQIAQVPIFDTEMPNPSR
jgi:hypothetical protein